MELSAISAVNSGSVNCLLSKGANRTFRGCCVRGLKASFLGDEDPKKKKTRVEPKGSLLGSDAGPCILPAASWREEGRLPRGGYHPRTGRAREMSPVRRTSQRSGLKGRAAGLTPHRGRRGETGRERLKRRSSSDRVVWWADPLPHLRCSHPAVSSRPRGWGEVGGGSRRAWAKGSPTGVRTGGAFRVPDRENFMSVLECHLCRTKSLLGLPVWDDLLSVSFKPVQPAKP